METCFFRRAKVLYCCTVYEFYVRLVPAKLLCPSVRREKSHCDALAHSMYDNSCAHQPRHLHDKRNLSIMLCHVITTSLQSIRLAGIQRRYAMPMQRGGQYTTISYIATPSMPLHFIFQTTMYSSLLLSLRFAIVTSSVYVFVGVVRIRRGGVEALRVQIGWGIPIVLYNPYTLCLLLSAVLSMSCDTLSTHWKKSTHIALSPPLRFKHFMLLSAAS
jgi:hypothetical protein